MEPKFRKVLNRADRRGTNRTLERSELLTRGRCSRRKDREVVGLRRAESRPACDRGSTGGRTDESRKSRVVRKDRGVSHSLG